MGRPNASSSLVNATFCVLYDPNTSNVMLWCVLEKFFICLFILNLSIRLFFCEVFVEVFV